MVIPNAPLICPLCQADVEFPHPSCQHCQASIRNATARDSQYLNTPYPIIDLTPESLGRLPDRQPLRTRMFQTQLIAYGYERLLPALWAMGLRQKGIDREGDRVEEWFADLQGTSGPAIALDLSCGTGIVTRRLIRDTTMNVIALDYSAEMLGELQARCREERIDPNRIAIVRADATHLPLKPNSIDAIYSGAAMHCWPDAEATFKQIHTVLKLGGKLYLTTFLKPLPSLVFRFFSPPEIRQIAKDAGFSGDRLQLEASGIYATLIATKLGSASNVT